MVKVSLFASSVRPKLYPQLFSSLEGTSVEYEVVFAGNVNPPQNNLNDVGLNVWRSSPPNNFKYILTENIKPAQCYEIARRHCTGEVVCWTADDAIYPKDCIGKAYNFWKKQNNEKCILSLLTRERYTEHYFMTELDDHTLKGRNTPLMAPFAMMSRAYLDKLGGVDRRYICGQYENDIVMRIYEDGGELIKFKEAPILVDHFVGHGGVTTVEGYNRPFGKGYPHDRKILEGSWIKDGCVMKKRQDAFEPFSDEDILVKSQSYNIKEMWL